MVWSHGACLSKELYSTGSTSTVDRQGVSNYAWEYIKWPYIDSACVTYNVSGHACNGCVCVHPYACVHAILICSVWPFHCTCQHTVLVIVTYAKHHNVH